MSIELRCGASRARLDADRGFTLYSMVVDGFDYLHTEPGFPEKGKVTHSGIPVLFPWPNRIAGAHFDWDGSSYDVPVTEPATGAGLHGFACHARWQILQSDTDQVTGEFILSRDAAEHAADWPADAGLRLTYQLAERSLLARATVFAPGPQPLPFGLGFHPYLRVPGSFDQWLLQCDATSHWPLQEMIPTGEILPVPPELDFRQPRAIGDAHLDDVLTGLPGVTAMSRRAALIGPETSIELFSDPAYRDYVLFTPASRDAVAIEPYTCTTDAVHMDSRGGWRVLQPSEQATFEWRIDVTEPS
jgi:aldose 1-epimerase